MSSAFICGLYYAAEVIPMRHFRKLQRSVALLCTLAMFATMLAAQQAAAPTKRPITHQDYDSWRSISAQQTSREGKFVAYAYVPQDGDGEIIVRNIATGVDWRAPRGYRPPVPPPDDPGTNVGEFQAEQARLLRPVFTADGKFVVFGTEPTKAEVTKDRKRRNRRRCRRMVSASWISQRARSHESNA